MIQKYTKIFVGDNTMIYKVLVIHLYGGFYKKKSGVGNFILVAIPKRRVMYPFIVKNIYLGLIVTQKKKYRRNNGIFVKFFFNKVVLLSEQKKFIGTRIYGPIALEIKKTKLMRILTIARKLC
jgi:large subunit ribosomal protein L14